MAGIARFDTVIMVDWSARSAPSPVRRTKDAIFACMVSDGRVTTAYFRTRDAAIAALTIELRAEVNRGHRVLTGFDFSFGYPRGFARAVTGTDDPLTLWEALADRVADGPRNENNRFNVAGGLNGLFPQPGPFWGCPRKNESPVMPFYKPRHTGFPFAERRLIETKLPRAKTCWQLMGAGSVGSQALLGIARLHRLRQAFGDALSVAPFQPPTTPIVLAEIYPSLLDAEVKAQRHPHEIMDAAQVRVMARAFAGLAPAMLDAMLREGDPREGWITGFGHEADLIAASRRFLQPAPTA